MAIRTVLLSRLLLSLILARKMLPFALNFHILFVSDHCNQLFRCEVFNDVKNSFY